MGNPESKGAPYKMVAPFAWPRAAAKLFGGGRGGSAGGGEADLPRQGGPKFTNRIRPIHHAEVPRPDGKDRIGMPNRSTHTHSPLKSCRPPGKFQAARPREAGPNVCSELSEWVRAMQVAVTAGQCHEARDSLFAMDHKHKWVHAFEPFKAISGDSGDNDT